MEGKVGREKGKNRLGIDRWMDGGWGGGEVDGWKHIYNVGYQLSTKTFILNFSSYFYFSANVFSCTQLSHQCISSL